VQGLFNKITRANRYLWCRTAGSQSSGSGGLGGSGRLRWLAEGHSRGGSSPEMADLGRPGLILDEIRPWRKLVACATHLDGWHGPAAAVAVRSAVGADWCGGARRRARVQAARARIVCEQGLRVCTVLRQAKNRACSEVQGLATTACGLARRRGTGERRSSRCGELGSTTSSAK
jgi:hypothetical protein